MDHETVSHVFAVPLYIKQWPDAAGVNAELERLILERAPREAKPYKSNVGGWHSENADLLTWGGPAVQQLGQWIFDATKDMTLASSGLTTVSGNFTAWAWANVLYPGGYNLVHDHPRHGWSGVYYVRPGERNPDNPLAGQIEFLDPRLGAAAQALPGRPFSDPLRIDPETGLMLMFPGWLKHCVHPYLGTSPRISISFNVRFEEAEQGETQGAERAQQG